MTYPSKSSLLIEELSLLVRHFGIQRVQGALSKVSRSLPDGKQSAKPPRGVSREPRRTNEASLLEPIRETYPEKYNLLNEFLICVKNRQILPTSQDIRYFAQIAGLKEISGKSREDLIPKLMRFLIGQPIEKLRADIPGANQISEQQRRMGYSVLTDKLVGQK